MNSDNHLCEVCKVNEKQYKCPRCGIFSCSLTCCKQHKLQNNCSGIRDKAVFVPLSEFREHTLKSDYHFLDDVLRTKGAAKRTFLATNMPESSRKKKRIQPASDTLLNSTQQNLDSYDESTKELVTEGAIRGVDLLLLPAGMSKRKENSSFFNRKNNTLMWKIQVVFVRSDQFLWQDLFSFDPARCNEGSQFYGFNMIDVAENAILEIFLDHSLETLKPSWLKEVSLKDVICLVRKIPSPANDPLFVEIDMKENIKNNLRGQVIIEYPTLYVVPIKLSDKFRRFISVNHFISPFELESKEHRINTASSVIHERTFHEEIFEVLCGNKHPQYKSILLNDDIGDQEGENGLIDEDVNEEIAGKAYDEFIRALTDLEDQNVDNLRSIIEEYDPQPEN